VTPLPQRSRTAAPLGEDETKVLGEAIRRYPATVEELRRELRMRPAAFDMALRNLVRLGLVELEPLEDCTFVRPMARIGPAPPPRPADEDDPAYL
jgi:DNA-binding MarR family transcriptional regulator